MVAAIISCKQRFVCLGIGHVQAYLEITGLVAKGLFRIDKFRYFSHNYVHVFVARIEILLMTYQTCRQSKLKKWCMSD